MLNILNDEHCIQADIFTNMQNHGWYTVEQAEQQKIQQAKQKMQTSSRRRSNGAKRPHRASAARPFCFAAVFRGGPMLLCALRAVFAPYMQTPGLTAALRVLRAAFALRRAPQAAFSFSGGFSPCSRHIPAGSSRAISLKR